MASQGAKQIMCGLHCGPLAGCALAFSSSFISNRQKKAKKAVDTLATRPYFDRRSYWAGLQEP
jgi:hypothetical protein